MPSTGTRRKRAPSKPPQAPPELQVPLFRPLVGVSEPGARTALINLGDSARLGVTLTPQTRGDFNTQAREALDRLERVLAAQPLPFRVTVKTVFLANAEDQPACDALLRAFYGQQMPVVTYVLQPPCDGAALALEVWAFGGKGVRFESFGPHCQAVSYDSVRWVHCGGVAPSQPRQGVYEETLDALSNLQRQLRSASADMEQVVRTWFYLGGITRKEGRFQRYHELNRARTDFYRDIRFNCSLLDPNSPRGVYPASTGIGAAGSGVVLSSLALQTRRDDVFLLPLENPQQTPAYAYHPKYSPKSPKFSRAMALVMGRYVTTWISGTASIVDSESRHLGDIEKQTEQTIDNIEKLIAPSNFALHGVNGAGATLEDLAKVRVYVKRPSDYESCRAVCNRRFGTVPTTYAVADVCRPELLVEIEGVAFSGCASMPRPARA